ncbi:MAG: hypothetical protein DI536_23585 [Archangium gephyra]|uniref:Pilus assembly protein n=1 Tax=Archangium gephyra TaxID=48 RepID=A0A2W5T4G1_9BACT|nr:MAG: hypothetical protein DI536_23585 [Archangium gephyra]
MRRGQATVELALGSLVFVAVLLVGIHLAEYAQLSLKVQEAETFAIWDASLRRVQSRGENGSTDARPFSRTMDDTTGVSARAQRRYRDFDGVRNGNSTTVVTRALTRGSRVSVDCRPDDGFNFAATATADDLLLDVGGLSCRSEAQVRAIRIPERFVQESEGGFFKESMIRADPMKVCGMGLPVSGACRGRLALLTNDWGLANDETRECKLDCANSPYKAMVRTMYAPPSGAGPALAATFAGAAPIAPADYFFSFSGEESGMQQTVGGEGKGEFFTGGGGLGMVPKTNTGHDCFLGKGGCQ